jgi:hypothetical protein
VSQLAAGSKKAGTWALPRSLPVSEPVSAPVSEPVSEPGMVVPSHTRTHLLSRLGADDWVVGSKPDRRPQTRWITRLRA